jgi:hypothetical protein
MGSLRPTRDPLLMIKTMITFIVLLALLIAIPWTSYAGHSRSGDTSVLIRGCFWDTPPCQGACAKVVPETVPANR